MGAMLDGSSRLLENPLRAHAFRPARDGDVLKANIDPSKKGNEERGPG